MRKRLTPDICSKYCGLPAQAIREGMKRGTIDIGFVDNPTGKRYAYYILPNKFFKWIGKEIPKEWR